MRFHQICCSVQAKLDVERFDLILKPCTLKSRREDDELKLGNVSKVHEQWPRELFRFLSIAFVSSLHRRFKPVWFHFDLSPHTLLSLNMALIEPTRPIFIMFYQRHFRPTACSPSPPPSHISNLRIRSLTYVSALQTNFYCVLSFPPARRCAAFIHTCFFLLVIAGLWLKRFCVAYFVSSRSQTRNGSRKENTENNLLDRPSVLWVWK